MTTYAIKWTNLNTINCQERFQCAGSDYAGACDCLRREIADMDNAWEEGVDYTAEIVEVEDGFDFDGQPDWN